MRLGLLLALGTLGLAGEWRADPCCYTVTFSYGGPSGGPVIVRKDLTQSDLEDALWSMQFGSEINRALVEHPDGKRRELLQKQDDGTWRREGT